MIKTYKLSTLLFATNRGADLPCSPGLKVGMTSDLYISRKRPAGAASALSQAKISLIGFTLNRLLILGAESMAFGKLNNGILYGEFSGTRVVTNPAGFELHVAGERISPEEIIAMIFIHALTFGDNKELKSQYHVALKAMNSLGKVRPETVFKLCDSFYYGCAKRIGNEIQVVTEEGDEQIDACLRSGELKTVPELQEASGVSKCKATVVKERKKKQEVKKTDLLELLSECKSGKYKIPYEWDESQADYIQPISALDGYIPTAEFRSILTKVTYRLGKVISRLPSLDISKGADRVAAIGQDYVNLTLSGKPGTGKTKLVHMLASATGMPVYTISNSHNTDEDEYEGKTKMINGAACSVETDTLKCVEHGGILLLEEINLVNAAVAMGALGQLVEFPFILKKFGYEPIRRHPLCVIITTMNTGTAGSKSMSQPFANRFKQSFVLNDPKKGDFIRILRNTGAEADVCRWVYDCYDRITACVEEDSMADVESILLSLSLRSCVGAIENIQEGMEPAEAIRNSIIGKIAETDRDVAENCMKVLKSMRTPDFD